MLRPNANFGVDGWDSFARRNSGGESRIRPSWPTKWASGMDDPFGSNPTPAWGHVGQVGGCQNNLEVGDPLTGKNIQTVTMPNGFTYHLQELAFFSWFYGAPSIA